MFCRSVLKKVLERQGYEDVCTRKLRPGKKIWSLLQLFNRQLLEENESWGLFCSDEIDPSLRINFIQASGAVTASSSSCCKIFSYVVTSVVNPAPNQRPDFFFFVYLKCPLSSYKIHVRIALEVLYWKITISNSLFRKE